MILRRSLYVVALVCLCSTIASGQAFDFAISSVGGVSPNTPSVILNFDVSGGDGSLYDTAETTVAAASCDMGATATISGLAFGGGSLMSPPGVSAGNLYSASLVGGTTSTGTLFQFDVAVTGGTAGEVCTFTPTGSAVFDTGVAKSTGLQSPGTITIVPEPSGILLLGAALAGLGLIRRRHQ